MIFSSAVILGTGSLPLTVAAALKTAGLSPVIFDTGEKPSAFLERRCEKLAFPYEAPEIPALFQQLSGISEPTLLISAINPRILPATVLSNPFLTAIRRFFPGIPAGMLKCGPFLRETRRPASPGIS